MDAQELRNLHEAYLEVYQLDEKENSEYEKASDAALDARYGYGRAQGDKRSFGRAANRSSAAAALRAIRRGLRSGSGTSREAGADAVHQGWAKTAKTSTDQTPEKKAKRAKLADTPYSQLPDDEKEKDRVSFDAVRATYNRRNQREEYDIYDIILSHLLDEGYAETLEAAEAIMVNMDEEWAQSIVEEILDEAEGSFGQTPKATAAYGKLAIKRRETPASKFPKRGDKTRLQKSAEKHHYRTLNRNVGNRGRRSSEPSPVGSDRRNMDQEARDTARGRDEYGHTGYDRDFDGGPSAPGSKPKGKKLARQIQTGVSAAESFDLFDYILEHLVAEGYADTNKASIVIMANMSEEWRKSIVDEENHPVYGRGGEQRRTQTPRQIGVKGAPHNIPKGGTTISGRDPEGRRLFTGNQDRGKGNKARRRAGKEVEDTRG